MKKIFIFFGAALLFALSLNTYAQVKPNESTTTAVNTNASAASYVVRYEGGMFGFNGKEEGMLRFDDMNERVVFYGEDKKEKFSISYAAMLVIYPNSTKVQSGTGRTIGALPLPGAGIGGSFLKKKKNYLIIQFRDPDVDVQGSATFLVDTNALLLSAVNAIGEKAKLTKRGDAYYRPKPTPKPVI